MMSWFFSIYLKEGKGERPTMHLLPVKMNTKTSEAKNLELHPGITFRQQNPAHWAITCCLQGWVYKEQKYAPGLKPKQYLNTVPVVP